ncbi:DOMON-like domain-containing protein [Hydrogenophaga pseudoflava]|uniref:DOMON-like domain-containing protein n=1 Tax=Hydrogenophaga pseudoflava TaxID=47421 RepID=UPI0027E4CC14|nr:DOMON-like domain-containing protein [Hydrogenophaga pseudoflava]MDQ7744284.1 DOMON-like domain-containing protein [Hydrogenophaga pseudoflava]
MSSASSDGLPAAPLPLLVHPSERGPAGMSVSVSLAPVGSDDGPGWLLRYRLEGDIGALALPSPAAGAADGLWRHTCLEAFVQDGDGPGYHEFNLSPSGQWAVYRFDAERQRLPGDAPPAVGPTITTERAHRSLVLQAWLPGTLLPARPTAIGLTAVIETVDGELSHWALQHPSADRPDFHHSAGWTHRLA